MSKVELQTKPIAPGDLPASVVIGTALDAYGWVSVRSPAYAATGDGSTDDTAAIQAAINACPRGGTVFLPNGVYKITSALTIPTSITLRGAGIGEVWSTRANSGGTQVPGAAPWLAGAVIRQDTAATNAISITATGLTVHMFDFGIMFGAAIAFSNTGHGVYGVPAAVDGAHLENGLVSCRWDNVVVFGHDGNHYAFFTLNNNYGQSSALRGYGGGGWYIETNTASAFGNGRVDGTFFAVIAGGTADGFHQVSGATGFPGDLNLMTYVRPQANLLSSMSGLPIGTAYPALVSTPVTNAQLPWKDVGTPNNILLVAPDLEIPGTGGFLPPSFGSQTVVIPGGGIMPTATSYLRRKLLPTKPTVAPAGGAGSASGGTAVISNVFVGADDERGQVFITVGTSPNGANGAACVVVTFGAAMRNGPGAILLSPIYPPTSAAAQFYIKNISATAFEVWSNAGLTASTQYSFVYHVIG